MAIAWRERWSSNWLELKVNQPVPFDDSSTIGNGVADPDADLYRAGAPHSQPLQSEERRARNGPHHREEASTRNLRRILPSHVDVRIDRDSWPIPPIFDWLQQLGQIDDDEMDRVFNMGLGFVLVVSSYYADTHSRRSATIRDLPATRSDKWNEEPAASSGRHGGDFLRASFAAAVHYG
jgi:hypothetical protein